MMLIYLDPRYWYRRWFVPGPIYLDVKDDGSMMMTYPDSAIARRRAWLQATAKSQWSVGIGCTLLGFLLGKLF